MTGHSRGGRKPRPTHLKVLKGETRPSRTERTGIEIAPAGDLSPPDFLTNADALAEWGRITAILEPHGVLTDADLAMLGHYCRLHGRIVAMYRTDQSPSAAELARLQSMAAEFGLTPSSRTKVPRSTNQPTNPFLRNAKPIAG